MRSRHRRVLPKHLIRSGQLNDDLDRTANGSEDHLSAERRDLAVEREDSAQSGRIEDSCTRKIEYEIADATLDTALTGRLEIRSVAEV